MRAKLIAAALVLLVVLAVSIYAQHAIGRDTEDMRALSDQAMAAAKNGDAERAKQLLDQLQQRLDEDRPRLEVLTLHENINQASSRMVEARYQLMAGNLDDFQGTLAQLNEELTIVFEQQRLSWGNLF